MNYALLVSGWVVYFTLHSVLATEHIKEKARRLLKSRFHLYRLAYSILAVIGLFALLFFNGRLATDRFFESTGFVRYASLMLTTAGVMIVQRSFRNYSLKGFLGLAEEKQELKTDGLLHYVRHPIYAGLVLITIGFFLFIPDWPTLLSCSCLIIYLPIGIYLEEKKLIKQFGEPYLQYKKEVPAIFPRLW